MAGIVLVGWVLSAASLLVGIVLFLMRISSDSAGRVWWPLCVGILFAVLTVQLAEQFALSPGGGSPVLTALFNTVQIFILERDAPSMTDEIQELLGALAEPYVGYGVLLSLVAPIATAGSAVLAFSHFVSLPLLWLRSARRETYVFSELNESSLALASSIQRHYAESTPPARCTIAFAHSAVCEDEDLLNEARTQGMLFSKHSIDRLMRWCRGREHSHVVLSELSGAANIVEGLRLTEMVPQAKRRLAASVHVFSDVSDTEGFADVMAQRVSQKGGCKVRRIDPAVAAVRQALIAYPLFLVGDPAKTTLEELYGRVDRRILIIGSDGLATEFLKATLWCGRGHGIHVTIDVVDEDVARLRQQLAYSCPEIVSNLGEQGYDLCFHSCPCSSEAFVELMGEVGCELTYVFVSQADDLQTAGVARRVRGLIEACRMRAGAAGASPLVLAVVRDSSIAAALGQAQTPQGQPYDIQVVPRGDDLLTYENLFLPHAERWATKLHRAVWGCYDAPQSERRALADQADDAFEASELNRLSAMASVTFCKHVLFSYCRRVWAEEADGGIDRAHLPEATAWMRPADDAAMDAAWIAYGQLVASGAPVWLRRLEHERWVAYVRTLGYELADGAALAALEREGSLQCQLARLHACLVGFDELPAVCDGAVEEAGDCVLRHLPEIIRGV